MNQIGRYGIEVGDIYEAADGADRFEMVLDVTTYEDVDDVLVAQFKDGNLVEGTIRRIDAFKLHMVRYSLLRKWNA